MGNWLLISDEYRHEIIDALEDGYEQWQVRDEREVKEDAAKGIIRCYSSLHTLYEIPISVIREAETVCIVNGLLAPPNHGTPFFLLGENFRKDLSRRLERDGYKHLGEIIQSAPEVPLPEVHCFVDARRDEFEIIGWNQEDAKRRLEGDGRAESPLMWVSSWSAFPIGNNGVRRGRYFEELY